jgi:putative nucleotidyltransferase with HDIG domain
MSALQSPTVGSHPASEGRLPAALRALDHYPAVAHGRSELLEALSSQEPSVPKLVAFIESDVAMSAAVLRAANRRTGGTTRILAAVLGVPHAVQILGLDGVAATIREIPVAGFFQRASERISPERFRLHAVAVRSAAERIMHDCRPLPQADQVCAVAMLHDIGKLVLALIRPYRIDPRTGSPTALYRAERKELGPLDHATVGAALASRWGMPEEICDAIAAHHSPGTNPVAAVVCLADLLCHYAQGREVAPSELKAACEPLDIGEPALAELLFASSGVGAVRRTITQECPLSRRELAILQSLAGSKGGKEIAAEHCLSASTVRSHLHNIYRKLEVPGRVQAVFVAREHGWV